MLTKECYRCHRKFTDNEKPVRLITKTEGVIEKELTFCKPCYEKEEAESKVSRCVKEKLCKICGKVGRFITRKFRKLNRKEYRNWLIKGNGQSGDFTDEEFRIMMFGNIVMLTGVMGVMTDYLKRK